MRRVTFWSPLVAKYNWAHFLHGYQNATTFSIEISQLPTCLKQSFSTGFEWRQDEVDCYSPFKIPVNAVCIGMDRFQQQKLSSVKTCNGMSNEPWGTWAPECTIMYGFSVQPLFWSGTCTVQHVQSFNFLHAYVLLCFGTIFSCMSTTSKLGMLHSPLQNTAYHNASVCPWSCASLFISAPFAYAHD